MWGLVKLRTYERELSRNIEQLNRESPHSLPPALTELPAKLTHAHSLIITYHIILPLNHSIYLSSNTNYSI